MKLARPGAFLHFYDRLLDDVFALDPNVIVVHAESLRSEPWQWVDDARWAVRLAWRGQAGRRGIPVDPPEFSDCGRRQGPEALERSVRLLKSRFSDFGGISRAGRRFFDQARERGVQVVLLELERSGPLIEASGDAVGRWREDLFASLEPWPEIRVLSFSDALPLDHFCDFSHYNERGRERFLRWFVPQISEILNGGGA